MAKPQNELIMPKVDYEFQPIAMKPEWRKRFEIRRAAERFLRILAVLKPFRERRGAVGRIAGRPFLCFFLFDVKRKKAPSGGATPGSRLPKQGLINPRLKTFSYTLKTAGK
jgi:hypothetical protein